MKRFLLTLGLLSGLAFNALAQQTELDRVAVIVDQGVILESEIEQLLVTVKSNAQRSNQALPSDRVLRTQAIERLITEKLQLQMANRMGIQISDPQLEQTISNIAKSEGITLDKLRRDIASDGLSYDTYREKVRTELVTGEVTRANVRRRIYVTPQEISNLIKLMDEQGSNQVEYRLGHILIGFPSQPEQSDIDSAKERAEKVLTFLKDGSDFAKIATTSSSGAKALEGGDLGWLNVNSMPTLFAEAVQKEKKDALIGPIRSGAGFHILKIQDIRGLQTKEITEAKARHILIKPSIILSEENAKKMLEEFRTQLLAGEVKFEDLAKEHSADPGSALRGGDLGWSDPSVYVPAFKDALEAMQVGEIAEPFRSVHGWHLVELTDKRIGDVTEQFKQERAHQLLFNRKFGEETEAWIREMRDTAYVEVLE